MSINAIKTYREKAGLSQAEFARKCGWANNTTGYVGQSRIAQYETGDRKPPLDVCRLIVSVLQSEGVKCSLDKVFPPEGEVAA